MKKVKLTDIAPYSGKRVQPFDGVKRYMSTGDLKGDNLNFEDVTYESKPSRADILVSEGDILFAKMKNTNKALQINKELDGIIVSTGFSVHRPIENELYGEYFLHFLKHDSFQRQKNRLCTGAIQSAISNSGIERIFVPVPDYNDQLHIANLLSKAENLIAQRKESIRLLDEFLKSTFLEMFGEPVTNPKGWELKTLDKISNVGSSKRVFVEELVERGIPFFRGTEIGQLGEGKNITPTLYITQEHFEELKSHTGVPVIGDLLMPSICPDGRIFRVVNNESFYFKDGRVLWVKPDQKIVNSFYLHNTLKQLFITNYNKIASGTTFAELKIVALKKIQV